MPTNPTIPPRQARLAPAPAPSFAPPQVAPQSEAAPAYVPETATPNTSLPTSIGPLPSKQKNMLRDIAGLALAYSNENNVGPGNVTKQQDALLNAWTQNAHSDYSQFMFEQGLAQVGANPDVLFNEEAASARAQWSREDAQNAMSMLGLSAKDWTEYEKIVAEEHKRHMGLIGGIVEMAAGIVVSFIPGMAAVGVPMAVQGAGQVAGNS